VEFHPRYGFMFPQSVNGTFICKSEDVGHQRTLTVNAIQNPKTSYSEITEFISTPVSVECESKGAVQIHQEQHEGFTPGVVITKKETKLDGGGKWISLYELIADKPVNVNLTCVDENLKPIWTKLLGFLRK
jgi:hypothetical protein